MFATLRNRAHWSLVALTIVCALPSSALDSPTTITPTTWRDLPSPVYLWPGVGAIYYALPLPSGTQAHLIVIDLKSGKLNIRPELNDATTPTSVAAEKLKASAAINGGFFNLSDGESTSYVVVDGKQVTEPKNNKALTTNPKLTPYLDAIYNRTELRVLQTPRGQQLQIAAHNDPLPAGSKLLHSLQGGPRLLPQLKDKEEAFVRTDPDGKPQDSIGCHKQAARTAVGITGDGYAMFVCIAGSGQNPESSGLTLPALCDLLRSLGCTEAVNLDGGSSTTMFVRSKEAGATTSDAPSGKVVCGRTPETKVKSILLIQPALSK